MFKKLRIVCLLVLFGILVPVPGAMALESGIAKFIKDFRRCIPDKEILRIGVLGFHRDEERLSRSQQVNIRRNIEQNIQEIDDVIIAPSSDLGTIVEINRQSTGTAEKKIRQQIANARRVDGVVLFNVRQRKARKVIFQLTGISKSASCKVISEPLSLDVSVDRNFANAAQVFKRKARELLAVSNVKKIAILPFLSGKGMDNSCNRELVDHMSNALLRERDNASRVITDNQQLDVRQVRGEHAVKDKKNTIIIDGKFGCDGDGSHWVRVGFRRNGRPVIPSLTKTSITGLNCGCRSRTFFEKIRQEAKMCPAYFKMRARKGETFVGDYVNIRLRSKRKADLYCWYLAADKTAYILVPNPHNPGSGKISVQQEKRYPRDFGFPEQQYQQESNDMFGCFVREKPLPDEAHAYWMKKWGPKGGSGSNGELVEGEIVDMFQMMRRQEGTGECYVQVNVKERN